MHACHCCRSHLAILVMSRVIWTATRCAPSVNSRRRAALRTPAFSSAGTRDHSPVEELQSAMQTITAGTSIRKHGSFSRVPRVFRQELPTAFFATTIASSLIPCCTYPLSYTSAAWSIISLPVAVSYPIMSSSHLVMGLLSNREQGRQKARHRILFPFSDLCVCLVPYDVVKAESMCDGREHKGDAHSLVCFHGYPTHFK